MPHTAQAVRDGRLSLDLLDALGRANSGRRTKLFGEHEEALVNEIAGLRYRDGLIAISYWKIHANELLGVPEPPDEPATAFMSPVGDRWALSADLEAIAGTIVSDELDRLVGQIALADKKAGIERPTSQRRALALVAMALRSCSAPGSGSMRRPLFSVHIGDGTVANMCELSNGTVIQPAKLAPWIDTALLEVMLFSGKFTVIAASKRRTFTGALRRAIEVRDRHCQHPSGCDTPAEKCDVNHIVAVEHGGKTTQFNGNLECPPHNRLAHLHEDGGEPIPETGVTYLEQLRARLRWQYLRDYPDEAA